MIFRKGVGASVVPLGIGLTQNPAADVEGIVVKKDSVDIEVKDNENLSSSDEDTTEKVVSEPVAEKNLKNKKSVSHQPKTDVNENKDSTIMEIKNIKDITDESLKEVSASVISDFIESELEKASEQYTAEKREVEDALSAAKEETDNLKGEHEKMKEELESAKSAIEQMEAEKAKRQKQEQFNERMASLDEKFDLTDEEREVIASDIKDLDEDGYTDYSKKMSVLLSSKEKSEEVEASQPADIALAPPGKEWMYALEKMSDEDKIDVAKALMKKYASQLGLATETEGETEAAEENTQEVVDEAIEQADVQKESVPVTSEASEPTVFEKYKEAFTVEGFDIKL